MMAADKKHKHTHRPNRLSTGCINGCKESKLAHDGYTANVNSIGDLPIEYTWPNIILDNQNRQFTLFGEPTWNPF